MSRQTYSSGRCWQGKASPGCLVPVIAVCLHFALAAFSATSAPAESPRWNPEFWGVPRHPVQRQRGQAAHWDPQFWSAPQPVTRVAARPVTAGPQFPGQAPSYNLRLTFSEVFANRFVATNETRRGPVRDFIDGANVVGEHVTTTSTRLCLHPSPFSIQMSLVLDGEVHNQTIGSTPRAQVLTRGHHLIRIEKEIEFDGTRFATRTPAMFVTPRLDTLAASTQFDHVPFLGRYAAEFALNAAIRRTPRSEWIAARQITERSAPPFNDRIDFELAELNRSLQTYVHPFLNRPGLQPNVVAASSTTQQASLNFLILETPASAPGAMPPAPPPLNGGTVTVQLHDSLPNALISRQNLNGLRFDDASLLKMIDTALKRAGIHSPIPADQLNRPAMADLVLDQHSPFEFRFGEGRAEVIARFSIVPRLGPALENQILRIGIRPTLREDFVQLDFDPVTLETEARETPLAARALQQLILASIRDRLSSIRIPRTMNVPRKADPPVPLRLHHLSLEQGWLRLGWD